MQKKVERETVYIACAKEWRDWLQQHHHSEQGVWLLCHNAKSGRTVVPWSDLVDEALCFGWIDSTRKTIDHHSFVQLFSKRKKHSTWSAVNKEKVQKLIEEGRMTKAGYECIEMAKQNGSWSLLDEVEQLVIPDDLNEAFYDYDGSKAYFLSLSRSVRKMLLQWIVLAKRPETRARRIGEIARQAGLRQKPVQFR